LIGVRGEVCGGVRITHDRHYKIEELVSHRTPSFPSQIYMRRSPKA